MKLVPSNRLNSGQCDIWNGRNRRIIGRYERAFSAAWIVGFMTCHFHFTIAFVSPAGFGSGCAFDPVKSILSKKSFQSSSSIVSRCSNRRVKVGSLFPREMSTSGDEENNGVSPSQRYIRIKPLSDVSSRKFELQTCVATFEKVIDGKKVKLDLHSQVHFGDEAYFQYYNHPQFSSNYDRVHYELIVGEDLLTKKEQNDLVRTLAMPRNGLMPSTTDSNTAQQYDLKCQLDVVNYEKTNWVCADYSREEFQALRKQTSSSSFSPNLFPGAELLQALIQPTTPVQNGLRTRLFSNLFLSGDKLTSFMRSLLWIVPAPELFILLLDWSSLSPRPGGISPIASPVLECLLTGNFSQARKLIFSQIIVSGQANDGSSSLLVGGRNDFALRVVQHSITHDDCRTIALIYGGLHCRDLHTKLNQMGFALTKTDWRTAWTVDVPSLGRKPAKKIFLSTLLLFIYLAIGGVDWMASLKETVEGFEKGVDEGVLTGLLYVVRHVVLYLSLAKFVVEWDGNLFGDDGR